MGRRVQSEEGGGRHEERKEGGHGGRGRPVRKRSQQEKFVGRGERGYGMGGFHFFNLLWGILEGEKGTIH